jgi:hypothetical protein
VQPANRLALNALKRIHASLEQWTEVLGVLHQLAQLELDPTVRAATLREAAAVQEEHLKAPERAMELHRLAHNLLFDERISLDHLKRLAETHGLWEPYVEIMRAEIERAATADEKRERLLTCARVLEESAGRAQEAYDLLRGAMERRLSEGPLLEAAIGLLVRQKWWDELTTLFDRLARVSLEADQRVQHYRRLAEIHRHQGDDAKRVLEALVRGYLAKPH